MSEGTDIEHRLTTVEIKVLEHCSDIKNIREDIHRLEDSLKTDIISNRNLIIKILDNEIPHLQQDIDDVKLNGVSGKWDMLKIIGAISGIVSGIYIILTNMGNIAKLVYDFLSIFFL